MAPAFKEVEFDILYGHGISREGDLVDLASDANIIDKSGAWFSFAGERIGQGRENAKQFLIEHPDTYNTIEAKVLTHYGVRRIGIDVVDSATSSVIAPIGAELSDENKKAVRPPDTAQVSPRVPAASPTVAPTAVGSGPIGNGSKRPNA